MNKALEQFVKPEQLDGENAYKCSKYDSGASGMPVPGRGVSVDGLRVSEPPSSSL